MSTISLDYIIDDSRAEDNEMTALLLHDRLQDSIVINKFELSHVFDN